MKNEKNYKIVLRIFIAFLLYATSFYVMNTSLWRGMVAGFLILIGSRIQRIK